MRLFQILEGEHLYMSYEDLILLHPWVDLVLELFKGVMPTLVALLAIYLNNSFARERELIYRKKEFTVRLLYENVKLASRY